MEEYRDGWWWLLRHFGMLGSRQYIHPALCERLARFAALAALPPGCRLTQALMGLAQQRPSLKVT